MVLQKLLQRFGEEGRELGRAILSSLARNFQFTLFISGLRTLSAFPTSSHFWVFRAEKVGPQGSSRLFLVRATTVQRSTLICISKSILHRFEYCLADASTPGWACVLQILSRWCSDVVREGGILAPAWNVEYRALQASGLQASGVIARVPNLN